MCHLLILWNSQVFALSNPASGYLAVCHKEIWTQNCLILHFGLYFKWHESTCCFIAASVHFMNDTNACTLHYPQKFLYKPGMWYYSAPWFQAFAVWDLCVFAHLVSNCSVLFLWCCQLSSAWQKWALRTGYCNQHWHSKMIGSFTSTEPSAHPCLSVLTNLVSFFVWLCVVIWPANILRNLNKKPFNSLQYE